MEGIDRLLKRSQAGDREAFEELVRTQLGRLHAAAWHALGDRHLAEDVVQEVFLRVLRGRAPYRLRGSAAGWLLRTTVRVALDFARSGTARERREKAYAANQGPPANGGDPLVAAEEREALRRAVDGLPSLTRACLWLRFGEDLSVRQIAAVLGRGRSATAERLRRGVDRLHADLRVQGLTLGAAWPIGSGLRAISGPAAPEELAARIIDAAETVRRRSERTGGGQGLLPRPVSFLSGGASAVAMKVAASVLLAGGLIAVTWAIASKARSGGPPAPPGSPPMAVAERKESPPPPPAEPEPEQPSTAVAEAPEPEPPPASRLVIRVSDEAGAALPRATGPLVAGIVLHEGTPVAGARVGYWRSAGGWMSPDARSSTTNAEGRFALKSIYADQGTIYFHARGQGFSFARSGPVRVPLEAPVEDLVIRSLPGQDFEARVVDSEGRPAPRARVNLSRDDVPPLSTDAETDESGKVRFARLPLGPYKVWVESADRKQGATSAIDWQGPPAAEAVWTVTPQE